MVIGETAEMWRRLQLLCADVTLSDVEDSSSCMLTKTSHSGK
jgi:hypothetical protein